MNRKIASKLDVLDMDLRNLLEDLRIKDEKLLNTSPKEGAWSVTQVLNHLKLVEFYTLSYCRKKINARDLSNANFVSTLRLIVLKLYLITPLKFPAPGSVNTESLPEHDTIENINKQWADQRKLLREFLNDLTDAQLKLAVYKHPVAGRFSFPDMLRFIQGHFDHHKKQIYRTLKEVE